MDFGLFSTVDPGLATTFQYVSRAYAFQFSSSKAGSGTTLSTGLCGRVALQLERSVMNGHEERERAYWAAGPGPQTGWPLRESPRPRPSGLAPLTGTHVLVRGLVMELGRRGPVGLSDHQPAVGRRREAHAAAETLRQPLGRRAAEVEPEIQALEVEPEQQRPQLRIPCSPPVMVPAGASVSTMPAGSHSK